jgi:uncharacterized surface protein with fasciclin (FAS1) repeats
MNARKMIPTVALTLAAVIATPAAAQYGGMNGTKEKASANQMNIVEVAASAGTFNTLLTAAKAAGLAETLASGGPFTVFAPTDEAFAKLPEGTVEALLEDTEQLKAVLLYHVVSGKVTAADVAGLKRAETLQGGELKIDTSYGVKINDAKVVKADVMASNGVIHVIDTVLLP